MDFLFHKVSEKEKEEIKIQSKKIMDNFSKKLNEVREQVKESEPEKMEFEREENDGNSQEIDKKIFFDNAPSKNKDFILAEKGEW